jgi:hypothetical protein
MGIWGIMLIMINNNVMTNNSWFLSQLDSDFGDFLKNSGFSVTKIVSHSRLEEIHLEKNGFNYKIFSEVLEQDFIVYKYKNGNEIFRKDLDHQLSSVQDVLIGEL